ncbi:MAG: hypothetical protein HPY85_11775 [Anaerolineae bacterium]|nr:hypothetical protein [Anaerolineae bacterium]
MKKVPFLFSILIVMALLMSACKPDVSVTADEAAVEEAASEEAVAEESPASAADADSEEAADAEEEPETATVEEPSGYREAPMLAEQVAVGNLPPVEERLPAVPFVVGPGVLSEQVSLPDWQPGIYGGTLQAAHRGEFAPDIFIMANEAYLAGAGISTDGLQGDIFESYTVSADNRVFIFKMREGLKWSDGVPVTREDVEFAWFDVLNNAEIYPSGAPAVWRSPVTGNVATLEFVDDWSFALSFDDPYGSLVVEMSIKYWVGYTDLVKPAHYLKQYHKDYADETELLALIEANGYSGIEAWVNLFSQFDITNWEMCLENAIGFPSLYPWVLKEIKDGALMFERNPYYFKVDAEGQQLPYIDSIISARVDDVEMVSLRAIAGQVDYTRESPDIQQLSMFKEQEEAGNFNTMIYNQHNNAVINFNFEAKDEAFHEVINDVRFRTALNHAIDRKEINQTVYFGLAVPSEATPSDNSVYDMALANALLDEMGMTERDDEGFRMTPSGKKLVIYISYAKLLAEHTTISELVIEYWAELGVNTKMEEISQDLFTERENNSETMITVGWSPIALWVAHNRDDFQPSTIEWKRYWNISDEFDGIQPPPEAQELWDIYTDRKQAVTGSEQDKALVERLLANYNENLWRISLFVTPNVVLVSKDLCNIPQSGIGIAANYSGEEYYFCEGSGRN